MAVTILTGDSRRTLSTLPANSVQTCVTSPPYFGLRDYGHAGQMGQESTPEDYVDDMVALFDQVRRVLKEDGTLWLNVGDSYASTAPGTRNGSGTGLHADDERISQRADWRASELPIKGKDLFGIPWLLAFALRSDGWYLRSDIIWHKPNPMPESVTDRPTKAHEYVFLLSKSARYFYDAEAISEPSGGWNGSAFDDGKNAAVHPNVGKNRSGNKERKYGDDVDRPGSHLGRGVPWEGDTRNARSVWTVATQPFKGSHFATMPPELARRCILAGSKPGDMVLDPFGGAGTTGLVADRLGRHATLIELNPAYAEMARKRITDDAPLFAEVTPQTLGVAA